MPEMSMAALPRRDRFLKKSSRQRRGSGSIFFEDIAKLNESGRILVFTNETLRD
jgi:hypothetical protein